MPSVLFVVRLRTRECMRVSAVGGGRVGQTRRGACSAARRHEEKKEKGPATALDLRFHFSRAPVCVLSRVGTRSLARARGWVPCGLQPPPSSLSPSPPRCLSLRRFSSRVSCVAHWRPPQRRGTPPPCSLKSGINEHFQVRFFSFVLEALPCRRGGGEELPSFRHLLFVRVAGWPHGRIGVVTQLKMEKKKKTEAPT